MNTTALAPVHSFVRQDRARRPRFSRHIYRELGRLLLYGLVGYLTLLLWVLFTEAQEVYPGAFKQRPEPIPPLPPVATEVMLSTSDGLKLRASEIPAERPTAEWCIFFHGQWGRTRWDLAKVEALRENGLNVLMFDYRGYAGNPGKPTEEGLYRDGEAALRYLTHQKGVPLENVILYGHSLGSAVAIDLAARAEVRALIIDGAFRSLPVCGSERHPWLPVWLLASNRFESEQKIRRVSEPILILHGRYDRKVPVGHARELYAQAVAPRHLCELQGGHEDFQWSDPEQFREELKRFLTNPPSAYAGFWPPASMPPPAWGSLPW